MAEQPERKNSYNREDRNNSRRNNNDRQQNNNRYERREEKTEEPKAQATDSRNVTVDLRTNIGKSVSGIGDLDSKKNQIIADLGIVNNMLVDFYDQQLDAFGTQGLKDSQGRPYAAANYTTPEEKLSAIEGIIYYSKDRTQSFTEAFNKTQTVIKEQREKLKNKAIKLLDDNKELINDNKKLINDAKLDIENNKEQSKKLELNIADEKNKADAALAKQKFIEKKIEEIKDSLADLVTEQADINTEIENAKDAEIESNESGKKKNNSLSNYYNAKKERLGTLSREIQQKEKFIVDYNEQILDLKTEYDNAIKNAENLKKQKMNLDASTANKERNLGTLENKNSELKKKFNESVEPLEKAFDENVVGMYKNEQRLNYEKDSSLNKDDKDTTVEQQADESQIENETVEKTQGGNGTSSAASAGLPADVTEEQLSSNFINNFIRNSSTSQRKQIFDGPGYANIIAAMDGASSSDRKKLRNAILDMQYDLEDEIPDRDEFKNKMGNIFPAGEFDLDDIYDSIFSEDRRGNVHIANFSKLEREQLREMQKALDKFEKLKADGNLTLEQAQIFEENFAKYAKMGSLLENSGGNRFMKGFRRIFGGDMYNIRKGFLNSLSNYTDSRFTELNDQYSKHNSFLSQLGRNVESTPKYTENRGDVSRTDRRLSKQVEDGKMNYR